MFCKINERKTTLGSSTTLYKYMHYDGHRVQLFYGCIFVYVKNMLTYQGGFRMNININNET